MEFGELIPIVAIIATACMFIALLHFSHERRKLAADSRDKADLVRENEALHDTVERLEARMAVLERIATDPAERTAREIETLR